ncbi:MAG TPA: universal stress protein [Methanosarcina sp.]|nr:universal stress protein [Methanosarcina sp.]
MSSDLYRNIVIATDGSANFRKVISCGIEIAKLSGATVYVLYVVDTPSLISEIWTAGKEAIREMMVNDGKKVISKVKKIIEESGVEVKEVLLEGHPSDEIIKFAEHNNMDLIVMGTLGKTGFEKFMMGSVAQKVVRCSNVPVMVVRNWDQEDSKIICTQENGSVANSL